MPDITQPVRTLIWWGRSDPAYSRNAVVRAAMQRLGWAIHDVRPGLADALGLRSPTLPEGARLVWVPCFRQRDMMTAARFAKKHKLPLVMDPLISAYDKQVYERRKFADGSPRARRLLAWERRRFALADLVVADTGSHAAWFGEALGVDPARTAVVAVGAEDTLFTPQPVEEQSGRRVRVLFYGSFIDLQGPEVIARAAAICDGVDWSMLGEGPLRGSCEAIAQGKTHIRFEPWINYADLPGRIGKADILLGVFSDSAKAGRVVPNKVYQAMACARPVVTRVPLPGTFPWGDAASLAHSGVLTVGPNDPQAIVDAVMRLASDAALRRQAGEAARATYEQHGSVQRVTESVRAVLERALAGGRR